MMGMQTALSEQERLRDSLTYILGFVSAVKLQEPPQLSVAQLRSFKEKLDHLGDLFKAFIAKDREVGGRDTVEVPPDELARLLIALSAMIAALRAMMAVRAFIVDNVPEFASIWPEETQRIFEEGLDILEDVEETALLGLSAEFRAEIEAARKEAGIEADGTNRMRTT
jgi:hypothetical protein